MLEEGEIVLEKGDYIRKGRIDRKERGERLRKRRKGTSLLEKGKAVLVKEGKDGEEGEKERKKADRSISKAYMKKTE